MKPGTIDEDEPTCRHMFGETRRMGSHAEVRQIGIMCRRSSWRVRKHRQWMEAFYTVEQ